MIEKNENADLVFLEAALLEAKRAADEGEVPVGAVLVHQGAIIAAGRNARERLQTPVSHAEIFALEEGAKRLGSWRLSECTLYVTLEPCPMCLAACQQGRVARVVYGASDAKGGALSLGYALHSDPRMNHRFSVEYFQHEKCGEILTGFFQARRKQ